MHALSDGYQTGSYELWMPSHAIEFNKNLTCVIYPRKKIIKQNSKRRGRGNAAMAGSDRLTAPAGGRPRQGREHVENDLHNLYIYRGTHTHMSIIIIMMAFEGINSLLN